MAIIYKYPSDEITLNDYLIGTDQSEENVTRSFKVSEVVNTILASLNNSTVTSVTGANSTFISFTGGPITTSGTLTASLSATGTPSSLTYLRGDGTWALPGPTPTDITTITSGSTLTTDTASWNFTGTGVTANVSSNDQVTVDIPGVGTFVDSILDGIGITTTGDTTTNPSTGNVTITNSLYQLRAGGNTTLSSTTGDITISTVKNAGTVISVNPFIGTEVTDATTNAKLEIDLTGSNNYIRTVNEEGGQDVFATITEDDILPYNQLTSSNVKTSRAGNITQDMLSAIKTYIDNADKNKVANVEPSGYTTTAKAMQMVTLTITEYNQIVTKDPNTVYLIVGAGTAHTVTLNRILNITDTGTGGTASPSNYNVSTTINSNPGTSITGVNGTPYDFATSFTALNGYSISSGPTFSPTTPITGTINGSATLNQTITASITPPVSSCTLNLSINTSGISGPGAGYSLAPGYPSPASPQTTACGATVGYTVLYNVNSGYSGSFEYSSNNVNWSSNGSFSFTNNSGTVTIYVRGTITQNTSTAELNVDLSGVTVSGSSDTATSLITLGYQSSIPNNSFGKTISGLAAGASYKWNTPSVSAANTDSAGNVLVSENITFPAMSTYTMANPATSETRTISADSSSTLTYQPAVQPQFRKLDASAVMNAAITGTQYSLVNAVQTPSPASSGTYTYTTPSFQASGGYYFNPSAPTVSMSPIGSNGTVTFNVTGGQSGSGTSSGDPLIENNPTITGSATMTPITVTVKVTYILNSNATYQVTFTGSSSQTFTVYGSGNQQSTSFAVTSSNTVSFSLSRTGSSWCSSGACVGGQLYTPTCGSQYQCPASTPEGSGEWEAKVNGSRVIPYYETWTAGNTSLSSRSGGFAALNNNDTCEIVITEN